MKLHFQRALKQHWGIIFSQDISENVNFGDYTHIRKLGPKPPNMSNFLTIVFLRTVKHKIALPTSPQPVLGDNF